MRIKAAIGGTEFYNEPSQIDSSLKPSNAWIGSAIFFGWHKVPISYNPPSWITNPFNGKTVEKSNEPWWNLHDFKLNVGDIKTVWETSRFGWVLAFAQRAKTGDKQSLTRLNFWLSDWCRVNPAYYGPNWKCGQEASIRVMHLAMAARILGQLKTTQDMVRLICAHLKRICPTISYATAQDNNHGTSEAAALFIGGHWCYANGIREGAVWAKLGRHKLENRVKHLIASDGSFSQHSINYHRVLIDTLSIVEIWRQWLGLEEFSPIYMQRAQAATKFLFSLVEPNSGDAANIGGNDGAQLLQIVDTEYRDYRPSVQLSMALFAGKRAFINEEIIDNHAKWLGVHVSELPYTGIAGSHQFDKGGYTVLRNGNWMAVFKYPRYRFRPRHCDILHLDLWHRSENILRDGGSFSYNTAKCVHDYFTGSKAHNSIEFDRRDQMPTVGRFLRGCWPTARKVIFSRKEDKLLFAGAGYCDWKGARHYRTIGLDSNGLMVIDDVKGFRDQAILRWRLLPEKFSIDGNLVSFGKYNLKIRAKVPIKRFEIVKGWESRHYHRKTILPVLEIEINKPGRIITDIFKKD